MEFCSGPECAGSVDYRGTMNARIPLAVTTVAAAILFLSIAFVFTLVIASLVTGGPIDFLGEPEIADASGAAALILAA